MTRDAVRSRLGAPARSSGTKDFFVAGALHVRYDATERVERLEVAAIAGGEAIFDGVDRLALSAEEALAVVGRTASIDEAHWECPMTCVFPELDLSLWRSCLPEPVPDGTEGRTFEAAAIGVRGYFSRPRRSNRGEKRPAEGPEDPARR
jgi:hypothetical protein